MLYWIRKLKNDSFSITINLHDKKIETNIDEYYYNCAMTYIMY